METANESNSNVALESNIAVYKGYWSGQARQRRRLTYPALTKLRRFRHMLAVRGLNRRHKLLVFDQGFGTGDMLFSFPTDCSIAGGELGQSDIDAATAEARQLGYTEIDLRVFALGQPYSMEWWGRYDVLLSSHVLEHIADPLPVLRELTTLLKPGGTACIIVPINERPGEDANHFHWFTEASFRQLLETGGLVVEEMHSVDRLWQLLCPVFYRRQRQPRSIWRLLAILQNLATSPLPAFALAAMTACWLGLVCRGDSASHGATESMRRKTQATERYFAVTSSFLCFAD